jgi:hypothetical protein
LSEEGAVILIKVVNPTLLGAVDSASIIGEDGKFYFTLGYDKSAAGMAYAL